MCSSTNTQKFTLLNLIRIHGCNGFVYPYGGFPQTPSFSISKKQGLISDMFDAASLHSTAVL